MRSMGLVVAAVALATSGCDSEKDAKAAGSAAATASAAPAGCTDADTKLPELGFCVRVDKSWDFDGARKDNPVWYGKGAGEMLSISVLPDSKLEDWVGLPPPEGCTRETGEMAGGKGRWEYRPVCGSYKTAEFRVGVTGPKGVIRCSFQDPDAAKVKKWLDICKTIQLL